MALWALLPAIAGIGFSAMGRKQSAEGVEEGSATQAAIEGIKRDYAQKVFDEDIERLKPFYDAGKQAGVMYSDAIMNKLDQTETASYKAKRKLIDPGLEDAPEYVKKQTLDKLGAIEQEGQKGRLLDLQQIGLGMAGAAGASGSNLSNVLTQSYGLEGSAKASGLQEAAERRQSAWNIAASELSGIPAYMASNRKQQGPNYGTSGLMMGGAQWR